MLDLNEKYQLDNAIEAFNKQTGLTMLMATDTPILALEGNKRMEVDAFVRIREYEQIILPVEIKKWVPQANLGALIEQVKRLPGKGILVADYVNPKMAEKLKQENVQFIDKEGNAYLNAYPIYIYVKGNKQGTTQGRELNRPNEVAEFRIPFGQPKNRGRAFTYKGLKVLYTFLCDPERVNATYREIAAQADVAVGTVGLVLNDLKELGYLEGRVNKANRRLRNLRKLLDRWVETYPETLQPKQLIGDFNADEPYWWKQVDIQKYHGYWGGEIAGAKYTDYLKPEIATVYLQDDHYKRLIMDQRLHIVGMQGRTGTRVKLYKAFWHDKENGQTDIVHPVLAYADLIATADPRNQETAQLIYAKHLAQYIEND